MEDIAGEREVREQLKFENLVKEEKKTPEIIPILPGEFQPRKVEELIPEMDILPDTYIIYPTGGYHPFYGVPNTLPRYQLLIWPYVKRIKYSLHGRKYVERKDRPNHDNSQINPFFGTNEYPQIILDRSSYRSAYSTRDKKMHRVPDVANQRLHRLVALAYVPNPEKKKTFAIKIMIERVILLRI